MFIKSNQRERSTTAYISWSKTLTSFGFAVKFDVLVKSPM